MNHLIKAETAQGNDFYFQAIFISSQGICGLMVDKLREIDTLLKFNAVDIEQGQDMATRALFDILSGSSMSLYVHLSMEGQIELLDKVKKHLPYSTEKIHSALCAEIDDLINGCKEQIELLESDGEGSSYGK